MINKCLTNCWDQAKSEKKPDFCKCCFSNERSLSNIISWFLAASLTFLDTQPKLYLLKIVDETVKSDYRYQSPCHRRIFGVTCHWHARMHFDLHQPKKETMQQKKNNPKNIPHMFTRRQRCASLAVWTTRKNSHSRPAPDGFNTMRYACCEMPQFNGNSLKTIT